MNCPYPTLPAEQLSLWFYQAFYADYQTCLLAGGSEPEYRPATDKCPDHRIIFTRDYCASALHEVAHWCVAGPARRLLADYGYWYTADGRSPAQQDQFERVEARPQALEWIFSRACGLGFRVSADNLNAGLGASTGFKRAIVAEVQRYCQQGLTSRAEIWVQTLCHHCHTHNVLNADAYCLQDLA
ncbi:MAG: elongation factor P hydroxylase [Cellvibrionaceae bacterium]|nr:elongation factor P hydroxylase [Cellvibrionaceae bacterium]